MKNLINISKARVMYREKKIVKRRKIPKVAKRKSRSQYNLISWHFHYNFRRFFEICFRKAYTRIQQKKKSVVWYIQTFFRH